MKIRNVVIEGRNKGEKIGFPTINLKIEDKAKNILEAGVYSGMVFWDGNSKKAGIFIRPDKEMLEAHILGFYGNLRGKTVEVEIGKKIREAINFSSDEELISQIGRDIEKITTIK
ncbi:MAG: riboflavin kinase [uncultured bacterium]|nr:MAG: riboflavin kinase [uncultured bacterium]HBR71915.1 hypothetical protein [Candidatus Moranbacteria bacterium]